MKILLISNMFPSKTNPSYGIFVENFEKQNINEGIEINKAVICGRGISKIDKIKKYLFFFVDVYKKIKKDDYDLIYVHYAEHSLLPLIILKSFIKKPLVINAHGDDILYPSVISSLVFKIIQNSDLLVVPSIYFKKFAIKKYNHQNVFVSPSGGIDISLFRPLELKKDNIFTIGYVSRLDKGKGWDTLLNSIKLLNYKHLKFKVLIIGDGEQKNLLLSKIEELKLWQVINYLGPKAQYELPNYFNQMDLFVFPTTRDAESLGLVGLEAMACGVPVIGSNIGGLPSYITDAVNGKLFEPGNVEELAKCIEDFISMDRTHFNTYKENALKTIKTKYDAEIVAKKLIEKLRGLSLCVES